MNTTMCWKCNHVYPIDAPRCYKCNAANANVDPDKATAEAAAIEASRKNAQLKAQEQPFKSGSMPVVTHPFPATGTIVPTVANRPSRSEMLSVLGSTFGGDADTALGWILAEFRGDIEFAARREAA